MALTIVGFSGQRGVELNETGINVETFEVRYYPSVAEKIPSNLGEPRGRVFSSDFSRDITITGEVLGATGLMAATLAVAVVPANDTATFGTGAGSIFLDEVTETQGRAAWRAISMKLSSDPGVVLP